MPILRKSILLLMLATAAPALACPTCLETAASSPESSQRALRRSIAVLLIPTLLFMGTIGVVVYRNQSPGADD